MAAALGTLAFLTCDVHNGHGTTVFETFAFECGNMERRRRGRARLLCIGQKVFLGVLEAWAGPF